MGDKGTANQGDDISGVVHEVGENVSEFKKGDRVAAFHEMMKPGELRAMFPFIGVGGGSCIGIGGRPRENTGCSSAKVAWLLLLNVGQCGWNA